DSAGAKFNILIRSEYHALARSSSYERRRSGTDVNTSTRRADMASDWLMCCSFGWINKAATITSNEIKGKSSQQDTSGQISTMENRNQRFNRRIQRPKEVVGVEAVVIRHATTAKVEHFSIIQEGGARRTPWNQWRCREEEGLVGWCLRCCKRAAPMAKTTRQQQEGAARRGHNRL
ncbi:hypothetical protein GW17_00050135, partial [Ensete ventricosum]